MFSFPETCFCGRRVRLSRFGVANGCGGDAYEAGITDGGRGESICGRTRLSTLGGGRRVRWDMDKR
jgi:hypothetical protein